MKWAVAIAVLLSATGLAAAQDNAVPMTKRAKTAHGTAHVAPPLPVVIPQQFAPPQEVYASQPETAAAAASDNAVSLPGWNLAKDRGIQGASRMMVGPGECGATDAV